jgi:hypothetical protein
MLDQNFAAGFHLYSRAQSLFSRIFRGQAYGIFTELESTPPIRRAMRFHRGLVSRLLTHSTALATMRRKEGFSMS